jgi:NADH-quinone oxidoreductase subunit J
MLDVDFARLRAGFASYLVPGLILAGVLLFEIIVAVLAWDAGGIPVARRGATPEGVSNIEALGELLYTRYVFIFEAAGIILLVAMVGAIVLTSRKRSGLRPQNVRKQISRRPQDATVNMQPGVGQGVEL